MGGGIQGIPGYPSLETPRYQVGNLQDLVGNFSDTLIKEKESNFAVTQPNLLVLQVKSDYCKCQ
jgi:hypothetical protein